MGVNTTINVTKSASLEYILKRLKTIHTDMLDVLVGILCSRTIVHGDLDLDDALTIRKNYETYVRSAIHITSISNLDAVMDVLLDEMLYNCIIIDDDGPNDNHLLII
jgi:hypothetical protein